MFEVSPWEVEGEDVVFDEFHSIEWGGIEWQLASRNAIYFNPFYAKRKNGPLLWLQESIKSKWRGDDGEVSVESIRKAFGDELTRERWTRKLYFQSENELREGGNSTRFTVTLFPDGKGQRAKRHASDHGSFFWTGPSDFLLNASAEEVLSLLNNESNQARFTYARAFLDFDDSKRFAEVWHWQNDEREQFQRLLIGALLAQDELWRDSNSVFLSVDFTQDTGNERTTIFSNGAFISVSPALREVVQVVTERFGPHIHAQQVEEHLCLHQLLQRNPYHLQLQPQLLTYHERIEAALAWREWLAKTQG